MRDVLSTLSSREIAIAFWSLVALSAALSIRTVRHGLWAVVKATFFSRLILVWVSLAAYAALVILALSALDVWTTTHIKDTIVWFTFGAVTYPFQFQEPEKTPRVLRTLLRDSLSVLIIVEVFVDTYTFSLPVELVIVPAVTIIAMMGAVAETREEHRPVARILGTVQAIVGFGLLGLVVSRAIADPDLAFIPALTSALIVVVLSVACYPYIQGLRIAFAHESLLWRIGWKRQVSRPFQHYAAFRILRYLRFQPTAIAPFVRRNAFALNEVVDRRSLEALLDTDRAAWRSQATERGPAA